MNKGRLSEEFRNRTKQFAADVIWKKLGGALQETDESALWLELLREECGIDPALTKPLEREADELMAILTTMINKTKGKG